MPGRATCEECRDLNLNSCDNCSKPDHVNMSNRLAIEVFNITRTQETEYLTLTLAKGGTEDDYNKILLIDTINRRINGREQT